ncbi:GLPGLI family protein [Winogradskyella sp. F6397]|uniref:GLPGLI family protein n=1 Tax=Winogradskyella marina TaxID=2785530 RepID=A0ABS0ELA5_9FLAO|nr:MULTISPECIES: GLPGLI family protein [Winogradskyella]MBF8151213.1 GLPGLI family protein [Winogradskyella marina]
MKLIHIIVFTLFIGNCHSQNSIKSGRLVYSVTFNYTETKKETSASKFLEKSVEALREFNFNLDFNNSKSLYYLDKSMISDKESDTYFKAALKIAGDVEVFTDLNIQLSKTRKNFLGDDFIITDSLTYDWKITKETKLIGEYLCYKAELEIETTYLNPKGKKVFAWFTYLIPLSHGPKGYSGLPGIILELKENNLIYSLQKLEFDKSEIKIPKNGIKINRSDYNKYVKQKIKEFKFE